MDNTIKKKCIIVRCLHRSLSLHQVLQKANEIQNVNYWEISKDKSVIFLTFRWGRYNLEQISELLMSLCDVDVTISYLNYAPKNNYRKNEDIMFGNPRLKKWKPNFMNSAIGKSGVNDIFFHKEYISYQNRIINQVYVQLCSIINEPINDRCMLSLFGYGSIVYERLLGLLDQINNMDNIHYWFSKIIFEESKTFIVNGDKLLSNYSIAIDEKVQNGGNGMTKRCSFVTIKSNMYIDIYKQYIVLMTSPKTLIVFVYNGSWYTLSYFLYSYYISECRY
ncbi:MAG: hypothetical protein ACI4UK_02125, partial [Floccifex sp.]